MKRFTRGIIMLGLTGLWGLHLHAGTISTAAHEWNALSVKPTAVTSTVTNETVLVCQYVFNMATIKKADVGCGIQSTQWLYAPWGAWKPYPFFQSDVTKLSKSTLVILADDGGLGGSFCPAIRAEITLECGGQCKQCGGQSDQSCWCDTDCLKFGDCCKNRDEICTPKEEDPPKEETCTTMEIWCRDLDKDTYGDPATQESSCGAPGPSYVKDCHDCMDTGSPSNPAITLNMIKNTVTMYHDQDGDGWYSTMETASCPLSTKYKDGTWKAEFAVSWKGVDCNDTDKTIGGKKEFYKDGDGDGWTTPWSQQSCVHPGSPWKLESEIKGKPGDDCDDTQAAINPNSQWGFDGDGDGFVGSEKVLTQCQQPQGGPKFPHGKWMLKSDAKKEVDCNDSQAKLNPETKWYVDLDKDGVGDHFCNDGCKPNQMACSDYLRENEAAPFKKTYSLSSLVKMHGVAPKAPSMWNVVKEALNQKPFEHPHKEGPSRSPWPVQVTMPTQESPFEHIDLSTSIGGVKFSIQKGDCDDHDANVKDVASTTFYLDPDGDESGSAFPFTFASCQEYQSKKVRNELWGSVNKALVSACKKSFANHDDVQELKQSADALCDKSAQDGTLWVATNNLDCQNFVAVFHHTAKWWPDFDGDGWGSRKPLPQICRPHLSLPGAMTGYQCDQWVYKHSACRYKLMPQCAAYYGESACAPFESVMKYVTNENDCDDLVVHNPSAWLLDADGDGIGSLDNVACNNLDGHFVHDVVNVDCDDADASVGAAWMTFVDLDKDGFGSPHYGTQFSCANFAGEDVITNASDLNDRLKSPSMAHNIVFSSDQLFYVSAATPLLCYLPENNTTLQCTETWFLDPYFSAVMYERLNHKSPRFAYPIVTLSDLSGQTIDSDPYRRVTTAIGLLIRHVEKSHQQGELNALKMTDSASGNEYLAFKESGSIFAITPEAIQKGLFACFDSQSVSYQPVLTAPDISKYELNADQSQYLDLDHYATPFHSILDCLPNLEIVRSINDFGFSVISVIFNGKRYELDDLPGIKANSVSPDVYQAIPKAQDNDHDMLVDDIEAKYGLLTVTSAEEDPSKVAAAADSDGDGVLDGVEFYLSGNDMSYPKESKLKPVVYGDASVVPYVIEDEEDAEVWNNAIAKVSMMCQPGGVWDQIVSHLPPAWFNPSHTPLSAIALMKQGTLFTSPVLVPKQSQALLMRDKTYGLVSPNEDAIFIDYNRHKKWPWESVKNPSLQALFMEKTEELLVNTMLHEILHYELDFSYFKAFGWMDPIALEHMLIHPLVPAISGVDPDDLAQLLGGKTD